MTSTSGRTDFPQFRRRWRGYDRNEVDEFLRRTAADRQQLQEDLAQLETVMASRAGVRHRTPGREPVRQTGTQGLESQTAPAPARPPQGRQISNKAPERLRMWTTSRQHLLMGAMSLVALVSLAFAFHYLPPWSGPVAQVAASEDGLKSVPLPRPAFEPAGQPVDGLLLTLIARGSCWIRTTVDGEPPRERLLRPNDTIWLRAKEEAVLRVGDAAALSLLINNQPAKPLGAAGQVITTRITRVNYPNFLFGN
jgi:DivIVA domain-containing protein